VAIVVACTVLGFIAGCSSSGSGDEPYDRTDREAYRAERRDKAKKKKVGASVASYVPFVGPFASSGLRQSAHDDEAEANRDYYEELREYEEARRDAENQARVDATRRDTARRDEAARQAQADRAEANRDRSFPPSELDRTADKIALRIEQKLPRHDYVGEILAKTDKRLVLYRDVAESKAPHTTAQTAENLLDKVIVRLKQSSVINDYFLIATSRREAESLFERSEGGSREIVRADRNDAESPMRFSSEAIVAIQLRIYEKDQPGKTTWDVQVDVPNPRTRQLILKEEFPVP
ncbi:MAG: hypothetical protein AB7N71_09490, partial [Phycisphaerae bacterium]